MPQIYVCMHHPHRKPRLKKGIILPNCPFGNEKGKWMKPYGVRKNIFRETLPLRYYQIGVGIPTTPISTYEFFMHGIINRLCVISVDRHSKCDRQHRESGRAGSHETSG
jgi:hypothetical protein